MNNILDDANFGFDECEINGIKKLKKPYEQPVFAITRFVITTDLLTVSNQVDNGYGDWDDLGDGDDNGDDDW